MFLGTWLGNRSWQPSLRTCSRKICLEILLKTPSLCCWGKSSQASSWEEALKQVSRKRFPSKVNTCKYGSQKTVPKQGPRNRFQARFQAGTRLAGTGSQASVARKSWFQSKISRSNWEPLLANLFLGTLLENLFLATLLEKLFLGTLLGNLFLETLLGNFFWEPYLWTCSWETCLGTCSCWEPCLGTSSWERDWEPYLWTCSWEPCTGTCSGNLWLGTLLGNFFLKTLLGNQLAGNLAWTPLPGNLFLETLVWKPVLGTLFCLEKHVPGNLAWETCWEPCLDTSSWKPLPGCTCLKTCSGNLVSLGKNMVLEILLGKRFRKPWKRFLKSVLAKPVPGNLAWEPVPGNLFLGTLAWEPLPENLAWEPLPGSPCLGTSCWEPLPGNPCLGTCSWEPCLGTCSWKPLPGNPCQGTSSWKPSSW